jgi:hypothetical protein
MKQEPLEVLNQLLHRSCVGGERLEALLKNPDEDGAAMWFMHLPKSFNDALDIKQTSRKDNGKTVTIWTQGSGFAFKAGDTIYDTGKAYLEWKQALRHIKVCIQVRDAIEAQAGVASKSGSVSFDVLVPDEERSKLVLSTSSTLSQGEFVKLLISGQGLLRST